MIINSEELKRILPNDGPNIEEVSKYIEKYKDEIITIKYGGNIFISRQIFNDFISDLSILQKLGLSVVVVHGGGPRIKRELDNQNIKYPALFMGDSKLDHIAALSNNIDFIFVTKWTEFKKYKDYCSKNNLKTVSKVFEIC